MEVEAVKLGLEGRVKSGRAGKPAIAALANTGLGVGKGEEMRSSKDGAADNRERRSEGRGGNDPDMSRKDKGPSAGSCVANGGKWRGDSARPRPVRSVNITVLYEDLCIGQ